MRRLIPALCSALLLAPAVALAGPWARVGGDKDEPILLDRTSIRDAGGGLKAATMQSLRKPLSTPDGKAYLSVRSLHLYNCDAGTATLLAQDYYAGVLGRGEPVGSYKYESYDPEHIADDAPLKAALRAVCKASGKGR